MLSLLSTKKLHRVLETLWRVSMMFMRPAITVLEVYGFGWNLGHSKYIVCSWPWEILGVIRAEARVGERAEISNFTKFAHKTWIYVAMNPFERHFWKFTCKGSFSKKATCGRPCWTTSDISPRYFRNDHKSPKVMTGWPAYGMLAFHLCRCSQLKVIPMACTARTQRSPSPKKHSSAMPI